MDREVLVSDVVVQGHLGHSNLIKLDCFQSQIGKKRGQQNCSPGLLEGTQRVSECLQEAVLKGKGVQEGPV